MDHSSSLLTIGTIRRKSDQQRIHHERQYGHGGKSGPSGTVDLLLAEEKASAQRYRSRDWRERIGSEDD
jgi:hypothetical protein